MTSAKALAVCLWLTACADSSPALTRIMEARQLTTALRSELASAAGASDRAVMADADAASLEFAESARHSTAQVEQDLRALEGLIKGLDFAEEGRALAAVRTDFDKYRALDRDVLALAVENSNVKAQRLSFGAAHEAADRLQAALEPISSGSSGALRAALSVRQIEVLTAPHIAALDDKVMTELEQRMATLKTEAHDALDALQTHPEARAAQAALASFDTAQAEIIKLSRRNSNLRSLALSLGEKLHLASACQEQLDQLGQALDKRASPATR